MKIQPCHNNCKKLITVQLDEKDQKYKPYEVDGEGTIIQLHSCPNSEYNKNNNNRSAQGTQSQAAIPPQQQTAQSIPVNNPTLEAVILNQISSKLTDLQKQMDEAIEEKLDQIIEYCKNNNMMLDAMIAHFGITQPTTAAELYKKQMEQNQQQQPNYQPFEKKVNGQLEPTTQEEQKVYGWNSVPNPTDMNAPTEEDLAEEEEDKKLEEHGI